MFRKLKMTLVCLLVSASAATSFAGSTPTSPAQIPDTGLVQPEPQFVMTLGVCVTRQLGAGDACVPLSNARLEAKLQETSSASNYRDLTFRSKSRSSPPEAPAGTGASDPATDAGASAQVESLVKYREGFDLTVTPLYESDDVLVLRYEIAADHHAGWQYISAKPSLSERKPVIQTTHLVGTTRLRLGESTTLNRNGFEFVISYVERGLAP